LPTVSVVIATYNHRDFVVDALSSVFEQTFRDYEIIVVNDGSQDDTANLLRPFAESGAISYCEQTNAGPAAARNRGLAAAKGEFIAYLDDDDRWPQDKLEWQVLALLSNPEISVIAGGYSIIDEDGNENEGPLSREGAVTFESLFDRNPFCSPGQTLIRAERLRAIGGFDTSIWGSDDFDAWFRLLRTGGITYINRIALRYRLHPLNSSNDVTRIAHQALEVIRRHAKSAPAGAQTGLMVRGYVSVFKYALRKMLNNSKSVLRRGSLGGILKFISGLRFRRCRNEIGM